jgi:hypothetical protein
MWNEKGSPHFSTNQMKDDGHPCRSAEAVPKGCRDFLYITSRVIAFDTHENGSWVVRVTAFLELLGSSSVDKIELRKMERLRRGRFGWEMPYTWAQLKAFTKVSVVMRDAMAACIKNTSRW